MGFKYQKKFLEENGYLIEFSGKLEDCLKPQT